MFINSLIIDKDDELGTLCCANTALLQTVIKLLHLNGCHFLCAWPYGLDLVT